ncbi:putative thioredoxin domain-containing protein, partial [Apostichopus japonicus]
MAFSKLTLTCVFFYFFHFVQCDQSKPADNHHREHITNENFVIHRDSGDRFLVNFYGEGCARCEEYMADFNRVEETLRDAEIKMFDCNSKMVMQGLSVKRVPSLLYFRYGIPTFFDGVPVAEDIIEWVVDSHEVLTTELHDDTFEHHTQASSGATTGDWMVVFCIKAHADCTILLASLEHVALKLLNKVNAAWIDINHNPELKERFHLKKSTEILYFRHGNKYDYHLPDTEFSNLLAFASGAYQHSRADPVEPPKTPFDKVTEQIAEEIKPIENNQELPRDEPV